MSDEVTLQPVIESSPVTSVADEELRILMGPEPATEAVPETHDTVVEEPEEPLIDWRAELSAKMQAYRTRRKPRAPKYPSLQMPLQLPVEAGEPFDTFRVSADASRSSNALEPKSEPESEPEPMERRLGPELVAPASAPGLTPAPSPAPPTNLIEFPRSMESEAWDGLAEPVIEQPRILDAPELAPPEPALGGILLEPPQEPNPDPVADRPLRPASIMRRVFALAVDVIFVASATALWGWMASTITREIPPRPQLFISTAVAAGVLWLGYQYLLMVHSGTTLGLRTCRLELVALDGSLPGQKQRRWRLIASLLSAASMMLGYAWVLLDQDRLCWHDRITHTYLRVREPRPL